MKRDINFLKCKVLDEKKQSKSFVMYIVVAFGVFMLLAVAVMFFLNIQKLSKVERASKEIESQIASSNPQRAYAEMHRRKALYESKISVLADRLGGVELEKSAQGALSLEALDAILMNEYVLGPRPQAGSALSWEAFTGRDLIRSQIEYKDNQLTMRIFTKDLIASEKIAELTLLRGEKQTALNSANALIAQLNDEITDLQGTAAKIEALTNEITELTTQIDALQTEVDGYTPTAAVKVHLDALRALEEERASLVSEEYFKREVVKPRLEAELVAINERIISLTTQIDEAEDLANRQYQAKGHYNAILNELESYRSNVSQNLTSLPVGFVEEYTKSQYDADKNTYFTNLQSKKSAYSASTIALLRAIIDKNAVANRIAAFNGLIENVNNLDREIFQSAINEILSRINADDAVYKLLLNSNDSTDEIFSIIEAEAKVQEATTANTNAKNEYEQAKIHYTGLNTNFKAVLDKEKELEEELNNLNREIDSVKFKKLRRDFFDGLISFHEFSSETTERKNVVDQNIQRISQAIEGIVGDEDDPQPGTDAQAEVDMTSAVNQKNEEIETSLGAISSLILDYYDSSAGGTANPQNFATSYYSELVKIDAAKNKIEEAIATRDKVVKVTNQARKDNISKQLPSLIALQSILNERVLNISQVNTALMSLNNLKLNKQQSIQTRDSKNLEVIANDSRLLIVTLRLSVINTGQEQNEIEEAASNESNGGAEYVLHKARVNQLNSLKDSKSEKEIELSNQPTGNVDEIIADKSALKAQNEAIAAFNEQQIEEINTKMENVSLITKNLANYIEYLETSADTEKYVAHVTYNGWIKDGSIFADYPFVANITISLGERVTY